MLVLLAELSVGLLVHEVREVSVVLDSDLDDPAVLLGLVVDEGGVSLHVLVVSSHSACDGGVDVSGGLHALNAHDAVALGEAGADVGQVKVNDIAELALSEVSDANLGFLKIELCKGRAYLGLVVVLNPLVVRGELATRLFFQRTYRMVAKYLRL